MSNRRFWLGLLVGALIMCLLAATLGFVLVRVRWPGVAAYALRERSFGIQPRALRPRMPARWVGFGAMLCGPALLLGALLVGVLIGRTWQRRQGQRQPPSAGESPRAQPPVEAGQHEV